MAERRWWVSIPRAARSPNGSSRDRPRSRLGLLPGDRFLAVEGVPIWSADQLRGIIGSRADQLTEVKVLRHGQPVIVKVTPQILEQKAKRAQMGVRLGDEVVRPGPDAARSDLGITADDGLHSKSHPPPQGDGGRTGRPQRPGGHRRRTVGDDCLWRSAVWAVAGSGAERQSRRLQSAAGSGSGWRPHPVCGHRAGAAQTAQCPAGERHPDGLCRLDHHFHAVRDVSRFPAVHLGPTKADKSQTNEPAPAPQP